MFTRILPALVLVLCTENIVLAQGGGPPKVSSMTDPFVVLMVVIMVVLLLVIAILANTVIHTAMDFLKKENERKNSTGQKGAMLVLIGFILSSAHAIAQEVPAAKAADSYGGISTTAFWFMAFVIGAELLVILVMLYYLRVFLGKTKMEETFKEPATEVARVYKLKPRISLWEKLNSFRPVEQEAQIDLGHNYDGIRELDNRLPPWWLYGFYISILFAAIYLWRFHVSHTGPSSREELQIAMQEADEQKAEYLKRSANNIDENTVRTLTDATAISSGQSIFIQNCAACHGKAGEGIVGPNLTDDYWLHGGDIKDVFKTIKYGWPEKGMKSWKEDLSATQISQVASFIKSIHGTNPPNPKEKQGELYKESSAAGTETNKDTTALNTAVNSSK